MLDELKQSLKNSKPWWRRQDGIVSLFWYSALCQNIMSNRYSRAMINISVFFYKTCKKVGHVVKKFSESCKKACAIEHVITLQNTFLSPAVSPTNVIALNFFNLYGFKL